MAFDGIVMAAVKDDLNQKLTGGRIEKIHQPEKDEIILNIHNQGQKYRLLASAHPQDARIHISSSVKENPLSPPMFCMVLRKHLEGGRILSIQQDGMERILHINVSSIDEIGQPAEKKLIIEIMGKHSNLILIDSSTGTILDGIKRYSHALSRHREVLPGRSYTAPPEQGKLNPLSVTENDFRDKIINTNLETKVTNFILNNFTGISPIISREIAARVNLPEDLRIGDCGDYEIRLLWDSFSTLINIVQTAAFNPAVYFDGEKAVAFAAVTLLQYAGLAVKTGSISEVLDIYFTTRYNQNKLKQQQNDLLKLVNDEWERNLRKIAIQEEAIAEAGKAEEYKVNGDLLTANLYQIEAGQDSVAVINYYDPAGSKVIIPLDRRLTPAQNAQSYYRKYNKAKSTIQSATRQKEIALAEATYLESVQQSLNHSTATEEVREIKEELISGGYLKIKFAKNKKPVKEEKIKLKPLSFIAPDGIEIMVGKNNRQNDLLTIKLARDNDTWLHVKDIPGSHVLIKNNSTPVSNETLLAAAMLAALYSKARESGNVPVDYTLRKHVHKPRGAKPGMVIYTDQKTVFVNPDEQLINKLVKKKVEN